MEALCCDARRGFCSSYTVFHSILLLPRELRFQFLSTVILLPYFAGLWRWRTVTPSRCFCWGTNWPLTRTLSTSLGKAIRNLTSSWGDPVDQPWIRFLELNCAVFRSSIPVSDLCVSASYLPKDPALSVSRLKEWALRRFSEDQRLLLEA
jgi:hypothetical protein